MKKLAVLLGSLFVVITVLVIIFIIYYTEIENIDSEEKKKLEEEQIKNVLQEVDFDSYEIESNDF